MAQTESTAAGGFELTVLPADDWPAAVGDELVARVRANPRLRLCLPTGDTPTRVYARLAQAASSGQVSLADVTIILLDEYVGLAPGDAARGDNQLRHDLLELLPEKPRQYFPIRVDELTAEEAAEAHDRVADGGLDLALVGLGLNGHVGFNEPGSTAESPTRVVTLDERSRAVATEEYGAGRSPTRGVTLGLARLLQAREVWLLATGESKAGVVRAALRGPETPDCPASFLRRHPRLHAFIDTAAAQELG